MPGRIASSVTRTSAPTAKRRVDRTTSPTTNIPDEGPVTSLREAVCTLFTESYRTTNGTRKLVVNLRKIQEVCCYETTKSKKQAIQEDFDEEEFNAEVTRCILRILPIKRSETAGDRLVRFVGLFLRHATDADNAIFAQDDDVMQGQGLPETPTSRLTTRIISFLLPFLPAKDKIVRFRSTQIIAHLINTLDSIDDELFQPIRLSLLRRLRDKESTVRVQAVYGLGRLAGETDMNEDDEDSDDDNPAGSVLAKLLDILQNDPSADVRRSLLLNLPFTPTTLPFLLERARDSDAAIRRALYSRLLPALADFRHLSLTHREKLLRWGLRDRDDNVKKATARLFRERWIENCAQPRNEAGEPVELPAGQVAEPSLIGLLELLERIDVVNAGIDGGIALDAMKEFWLGRPDYCDYMEFGVDYWRDLSAEGAFVARTFNDFCREDGSSDSLREKMPEVTRFAFLVQQNINLLVKIVDRNALKDEAEEEEDQAQQEFIVEQLLHIALTLDYSDEVGRRTMFSLMREALAIPGLPEESTRLVTEVLRTTCGTNAASEREFAGIVLEAVAEVHDTIMGDEPSQADEVDSFHSARSEISGESTPRGPKRQLSEEEEEAKAIREMMVNLKCLHIAQCMLQNVDCGLEQNTHLVTMLNNLVIPAVRSQEAPIREKGLLCLGLCCLLDKNLAEENLTLFIHCFTKGHEALQNIAIQIIGDVLGAHPSLLATPVVNEDSEEEVQEHPFHKPIYKLFSRALRSSTAPIQSTACTALCKLMLSSPSTSLSGTSSILNNNELLRLLTIAYFDPETAGNPALRQALSYFLPVYCHSRKENMQRMGSIASAVLAWCVGVREELDVEGEEEAMGEMVGLNVVVAHLVDWTDGRKLAAALGGLGAAMDAEDDDSEVHVEWALELLEKILGVCSKEERKLYISVVSKLNHSSSAQHDKLEELLRLVTEAIDDKVAADTVSRNALVKVQTSLSKAMNTQKRGIGGKSESRAMSIALSVVDAGDESRLASEADVTETEDTTTVTPAASPRKKHNNRPATAPVWRNTTTVVEDSELEEESTEVEPPRTSTTMTLADRSRPVRQASSTGLNEKHDEEDEPTPQPVKRASKSRGRPAKTAPTAEIEESILETTEVEQPTTIAVARKPRGRPAKSVSVAPSASSSPDVEVEESMLQNTEVEVVAPVKKPRGRPPKNAIAEAGEAKTTGRRSVRAGRKKVEE